MGYEIIHCFNGQDCIYKECRWWSESGDNCKWTLTGIREDQYVKLFDGEPKTETPAPVAQTPPPPEQVREHAATHVPGVRQINTLREGEKGNKQNPISIKGTLTSDPMQRDVDTSRGPTTVTSAYLKDDSGEAKLSFWGDAGNEIMDFVKGDKLFFEGLYQIKAPYDGKPQIDAGKYYKVAKLN